MKNYAGVILALARAYRREGVAPRRDLIFAFFADEEAGGVWGARWIAKHRPDLLEGATEAIGEVGGFSVPLDIDRRAYLVATAEKGVSAARALRPRRVDVRLGEGDAQALGEQLRDHRARGQRERDRRQQERGEARGAHGREPRHLVPRFS